jgi:hypothetical protein
VNHPDHGRTYFVCTLMCLAVALLVGAGAYWLWGSTQDQIRDQGNRTTCVSVVVLSSVKASTPEERETLRLVLGTLRTVPRNLNCYRLIGLPEPKPTT